MHLSEEIRRRARAHNKGTALYRELMTWAERAEQMESRLKRYHPDKSCGACRGLLERHRDTVCTKCTQGALIAAGQSLILSPETIPPQAPP